MPRTSISQHLETCSTHAVRSHYRSANHSKSRGTSLIRRGLRVPPNRTWIARMATRNKRTITKTSASSDVHSTPANVQKHRRGGFTAASNDAIEVVLAAKLFSENVSAWGTCALELKRTTQAEIRGGLVVSQRFDPEHGPQHGPAGVVVDAVQSERPTRSALGASRARRQAASWRWRACQSQNPATGCGGSASCHRAAPVRRAVQPPRSYLNLAHAGRRDVGRILDALDAATRGAFQPFCFISEASHFCFIFGGERGHPNSVG